MTRIIKGIYYKIRLKKLRKNRRKILLIKLKTYTDNLEDNVEYVLKVIKSVLTVEYIESQGNLDKDYIQMIKGDIKVVNDFIINHRLEYIFNKDFYKEQITFIKSYLGEEI